MEAFPGNSRNVIPPTTSEEPKKIEKVIEGDVVRRKRSLGRKFKDTFVGGDMRSVGQYVTFEVLLPALKDTIADVASQGVERMLFGEARSTSRRTGRRPGGVPGGTYVQYNRFGSSNSSRSRPERDVSTRRARANHDLDDIILATRVEAEEVIDRLFDLVSKYGSVSVRDLYELLGVPASYTDDKWGWTDIRGAGASRVTGGYLLDLPRAEPLD